MEVRQDRSRAASGSGWLDDLRQDLAYGWRTLRRSPGFGAVATLFLFMCLQPIVGGLSDKIGRRPILIAFGILGTLFTVPILTTLHTIQTWWGAFFLIMAALIIVSGYTSINAVVKAELFPTEIRALGVGLPYALTVSIFGGTAEYIALWFKSIGMETGYYWYVTACIAVSLVVYVTMKDTRKHSRITTD